ncbi:MAG: UV DNA damage repair endonuclease UvsE [Chloroflexi bacterium]|nr:UV DNA damage repair endonuclease UvsE [Chloroflexota bacterium]
MLRRLGYACVCLSLEHGSPRGTILRNASPERLRGLIELNLAMLKRVIVFNVEHGVRLFRISSDLIPFGSHPVNTLAWWTEFRGPLREIGRIIREHDVRVSMHPGQYTVLSAPDARILDAARADLVFHARVLDALQVDTRHKVIVHVGGAYGDKEAALNRWVQAIRDLPNGVRARLVLENDERLFGAEDVLRASAAAGTPVVLDTFHHLVYAGPDAEAGLPDLIRRAAATWDHARDGVPKIHYSSQAEGQRPGAHAEYVDAAEFAQFLTLAPAEVEFDCMLEAKAKDRALFQLRETLGIAA